jgi:pimeloyl-ACP methyl ester carboxylesterase
VPTLVVAAEHGMPYSRPIVDALVTSFPHAERVVVPGATHFMSYQAPSVFNRVVLDFLARNPS